MPSSTPISAARSRPALPAALLLLALAACSGAPGPAPPAGAEPASPGSPEAPRPAVRVISDSPTAAALEERLRAALERYGEGLERVLAGQHVRGDELMAVAGDEMAAATADCLAAPDCRPQPFLDAYRELLTRHRTLLERQARRIGELETDLDEVEAEARREPGTSPYLPDVPAADGAASLLRGTDLRELITLNAPVKAALDDWLTWMRPQLMEAWQNYRYLRREMAPVYEQAGFPEALLFAMLATESGGKVHAVSRAGAAGPLQFMRSTGRLHGLGVVDGFDQRYDPAAATRANVAYLSDQLARLGGSLEKALAAYNGGESRVLRLHRSLDGAGLWDSRFYYSLPRETRRYVPRVLAAAWLFLHPERYNLEWPEIDDSRTALELVREASLSELTVCLGQWDNPYGWFRTLRNLNPAVEPGERLTAGHELTVPAFLVPVYRQRCTAGELLDRARELHAANYPEEPEMMRYVVQPGDSLGRIAARFRCVGVGELAAINGVRPPRYLIRSGQVLKIPACR